MRLVVAGFILAMAACAFPPEQTSDPAGEEPGNEEPGTTPSPTPTPGGDQDPGDGDDDSGTDDPDNDDPGDPTPTPTAVECTPGAAPSTFPTTSMGVSVGDSLEDFTACLTDVDGNEHHLYAHLGEVVLISMGAGWCGPCQDEAPDIQELYEDYQDQGFTVLMGMGAGYSQGSPPSTSFLSNWESTYGITFPVLADPDWTLQQYYKGGDEGYIPLNLIIDRDGVVVYNKVGALSVSEAKSIIESALAAPSSL